MVELGELTGKLAVVMGLRIRRGSVWFPLVHSSTRDPPLVPPVPGLFQIRGLLGHEVVSSTFNVVTRVPWTEYVEVRTVYEIKWSTGP